MPDRTHGKVHGGHGPVERTVKGCFFVALLPFPVSVPNARYGEGDSGLPITHERDVDASNLASIYES